MQKSKRKIVAEETLEIIRQGFYFNAKGEKIETKTYQKNAETKTIFYKGETLGKLLRSINQTPKFQTTEYIVRNQGTMEAVSELLKNNKKVLCLNFASAKNPGGGFLNGAQAQEECIARSTGLYTCQLAAWDYYEIHRNTRTCMYTHNMIYSPQVPVYKDTKGVNLDNIELVSIITSPAVNAGVVRRQEPKKVGLINLTMFERIHRMLAIAAHHEYDTLVLGAWGCGVFQNIPSDIAAEFHKALTGYFKHQFKTIVFAIKTKDEGRFVEPFRRQFLEKSK